MKKKSRSTVSQVKGVSIAATAIMVLLSLFWAGQATVSTRLPQSDQPVEFYANQTQDDLRQTFCHAIQKANQSVLLIIYSLSDASIMNELKQKAEQGVDVTVICDAKASRGAERKLGPKVNTIKRFADGLMHQKILVIDAMDTWIGSANMTSESLRMHGNLVNAIQSPELAAFIWEKAKSFIDDDPNSAFLHRNFVAGGQELELWFLPDDPEGVARIKQMIASAQKTIKVAMFTWTRQDFAQAIIQAAKRGVKTEVAIDHQSAKGASIKVVRLLQKNGIPVSLNQGNSLLHHKFLYIDGQTLVNGSANWTKAAFTQNDDCFIILHNLTETQKQQMDNLWKVIKTEGVAAE